MKYLGCKIMDMYKELTESAKLHEYVYHYTNFNALEEILKNNSLRLSRLDKVNDSLENSRISQLWNTKIFVLCFTYGLDNSKYFFENYGTIQLKFKVKDINMKQIYFDSELNNPMKKISDQGFVSDLNCKTYDDKNWRIFDSTFSDVYYTDSLEKHKDENGDEQNAGLIKLKLGYDNDNHLRNWSQEKETRLRVAVRPIGLEFALDEKNKIFYPKPKFKYIYVELPKIEEIRISLNENDFNVCDRYYIKTLLDAYGLLDKLHM